MDKILTSLQAAFPDYEGACPSDDMKLRDLEGWDSMTSVSFILELESVFETKLKGMVLKADTTMGQVRQMLRDRGAAV